MRRVEKEKYENQTSYGPSTNYVSSQRGREEGRGGGLEIAHQH